MAGTLLGPDPIDFMEHDASELERTLSLARLAQGGDARARERFFGRYTLRLRHIVSLRMGRLLRDFLEVDDIVQEALVRSLNHLDDLEIRSEGQLRNWMATVATNVISSEARRLTASIRDVRKERRAEAGPGDEERPPFEGAVETTPSQMAMARELEEDVERALLQVEPRQREVFVLLQLCGMSIAEAAAELRISESTVRAHLARCLARLSGILDAD